MSHIAMPIAALTTLASLIWQPPSPPLTAPALRSLRDMAAAAAAHRRPCHVLQHPCSAALAARPNVVDCCATPTTAAAAVLIAIPSEARGMCAVGWRWLSPST